ncbi:hypothetical protein JOF42_000817 [Microbacterium phyllosphaerae]|uniref:Uncharacterized protein n=1 Tax=Microbacterium phyllosphaerae TaxID=124798 RepID=A0ABS4WM91_9MICO|nr:hypothetical protein [Microbacterium phyllosphaerae]MBP2377322.1 hypothetical protein [Microbacterium phyllosphaerae]
MSRATSSPARVSPDSFDATSALPTAVSLAPLPASEAVGRATGIGRAPLVTKKSPPWQAAGIVGIIALIAAAMLPLIAQILSLPL